MRKRGRQDSNILDIVNDTMEETASSGISYQMGYMYEHSVGRRYLNVAKYPLKFQNLKT